MSQTCASLLFQIWMFKLWETPESDLALIKSEGPYTADKVWPRVFPVYSVQDQRVGEPENHCSSSRQSAGPAVRHVRGATGSTPTKQQTGESKIYHLNKKQRLNLH